MSRGVKFTEIGREIQCARCKDFWPNDNEFFFFTKGRAHSWCKACYMSDPKTIIKRQRWALKQRAKTRSTTEEQPMKPLFTTMALSAALAGCNPCADEASKSLVDAPAAETPAAADLTAAAPAAEPSPAPAPDGSITVCAQDSAGCGPSPYPLPPGRRRTDVATEPPCQGAACLATFGPVTY